MLCVAALALAPARAWAGTVTGNALSGVEGQELDNVTLASNNYPGAGTSTTINWGDGSSGSCIDETGLQAPPTSPPACWYWDGVADSYGAGVYGTHTYDLPDALDFKIVNGIGKFVDVPYTWTVQSPYETLTGTAQIAAPSMFAGPAPAVTALAGVAQQTDVATFSDANPGAEHDFQATVSWGDGQSDSNATVEANGRVFDVWDSHAYATPGTYTVTTSITDQIPGHVGFGPITEQATATVSSQGAESLVGQEGTPVSGVIAEYCGESGVPSSVAVNWGDGTPIDSDTTVSAVANDCVTVSASHTYAEAAATPYTFTVTPSPSSWAMAVSGTAMISDAPLTATFDTAGVASLGSSFTVPETQLATVVDSNPDAPPCTAGGACDVSATISWGDNTTSGGTVSALPDGAGLAIDGSHTYSEPGTYPIKVTVNDVHGASATATGTYTVAPPPPAKAGCLSPVPVVGATTGLYGKGLAPGTPNWGISSDDRVLRLGDLVICAIDSPWTYEGAPLSFGSVGLHSVASGIFRATGPIIVNGFELMPATESAATPYVIDTAGEGEISGPPSEVWLTEEQYAAEPSLFGDLGPVNLASDPWAVEGSTLAVVPAYSSATIDGLPLSGALPITITGVGTAQVSVAVKLPSVLTLAAYSGGPVTAAQAFDGEYPALAPPDTAPQSSCGSECLIHSTRRVALSASVRYDPRLPHDDYPCTLQIPPNLPVHLTFPAAFLGGLPVTNGYLDYDPSTGTLEGGGLFSIGGASISGFFEFVNGSFDGAGGCASGLDTPIIPELLQLDGISFDTFLNPTRFNSTATLGLLGLGSGGSAVDLQGGTMVVFATSGHTYTYNQDKSITGIDDIPGTDSILYGGPFNTTAIGIGGQYSPFGLPLSVKGYALYVFPGYVEFGGSWGVNVLNGALTASLSGAGQLWMPQGEFELQANGSFSVAGFGGSVGIVLSSKGIIGCANINIPDPPPFSGTLATLSEGAGYHWGQGLSGVNIWLLGGCSDNYGSYQVNASTSAVSDGSRSFTIKRGLADAMVRLVGGAGAPEVLITGPDDESASSGTGNHVVGARTGNRLIAIARMPKLGGTWIGLQNPAPGRWTVTPLPGSAPIASLAVADGIGPAVIHASVTGHGYTRQLRYSIHPRPGQSVQFAESGAGASHLIGTATGSRGTLQFKPAIGPAGPRRILAIVSIGGLPTGRLVVATYEAPGPPIAQAPRGLRVRRTQDMLDISWRTGANTTGLRLTVIEADGPRTLHILPGRAQGASVTAPIEGGAVVALAGVGPDGNVGPSASVRIAPPGLPSGVRGLRATRSGGIVRIAWLGQAAARDYRVSVRAGNAVEPSLLATTHRSLTVAIAPSAAARITVQAEGAPDVLGPPASIRLAPARGHRRRHK